MAIITTIILGSCLAIYYFIDISDSAKDITKDYEPWGEIGLFALSIFCNFFFCQSKMFLILFFS